MSTIRIGCARFAALPGEPEANLKAIEILTAAAAGNAANLLVLPEFAVIGDAGAEAIASSAELIPGPISHRLTTIARQHGVSLAIGLIERDPDKDCLYNTMLLIDGNGRECLRYRKVHLWINERKWATAGDTFSVGSWENIPVGMWVCYDTRFPEAARQLALNGAQLALVATAWVGPADEWELALRSRAMDNGIFVVGSVLEGERFRGDALIIDPHGRVIARSSPEGESVIYADLDMNVMKQFHSDVPLLDHRRPETYRKT